ncbi:hypothetical protein OIU74_030119 [Salix koriyanagi]|uniref:Uncharacterized protein n=1 Tax=Salix koriyanagi TaxID=2511006 RepID=A0A9Q0VFG5_9ROSI|nr:hypothetical protein OIU74_030119 [Salix koriyanagi]
MSKGSFKLEPAVTPTKYAVINTLRLIIEQACTLDFVCTSLSPLKNGVDEARAILARIYPAGEVENEMNAQCSFCSDAANQDLTQDHLRKVAGAKLDTSRLYFSACTLFTTRLEWELRRGS